MKHLGVTLIELIVVLAVIALLCALLVPAISASRHAAARVDCLGRLHQIGVAVNSYISKTGVIPPEILVDPGKSKPAGPWGVHVLLLPELEESALYNSINLGLIWSSAANTTAGRVSPGVFLCPDDSTPKTRRHGFVNYVACSGSGLFSGGLDVEVKSERSNGLFSVLVRPADCTDGLSHTAAFSEMIHAAGVSDGVAPPPESLKDLGVIRGFQVQPRTQTRLLEVCSGPTIPGSSSDPAGTPWVHSQFYTHLLTANLRSCFGWNIGGFFSPITASSRHSGGVNVLFGDAHVRFVEQTIDVNIWRALGSRSGNEPVPGF